MSKPNLTGLSISLASNANGRRFTAEEENLIIQLMTEAKSSNEQISIATIKNAVKDFNQSQKLEARTRAAVVNTINRLAKANKVDASVIVKDDSNREPYTDAEDNLIADALRKASDNGTQISIPDLHKILKESGISPKERSLPSVRVHVHNLLKPKKGDEKDEAETTDGTDETVTGQTSTTG